MTNEITKLHPVRRLNPAGGKIFRDWLMSAQDGYITAPAPRHLLESSMYSESATDLGNPMIKDSGFETAYELAEAVIDAIGRDQLDGLETDAALWNGISLALIDSLYPAEEDGRRKVRKFNRMFMADSSIFDAVHNKSYRHMAMAFTYCAINLPELAPYFLSGAPYLFSDATEQVLGRPELRSNQTLRSLLDYLYADQKTGKMVRAAGARRKKGAAWVGGYRDVALFVNQLMRNYNTEGMSVSELLDLIELDPNQVFMQSISKHVKRARKRLKVEAA